MRRTVVAAAVLSLTGLAVAGPAHAEPPTPGGCQEFGQNVASLAENGRGFGQQVRSLTSTTQGPVFPEVVVHDEQEDFCS